MERDNFYEPLSAGVSLIPEFPDNSNPENYRQFALGAHTETNNETIAELYRFIGSRVQSSSIVGHVDQPLQIRDILSSILNNTDSILARVREDTVHAANSMFTYEWGGVNGFRHGVIPVRFPSKNLWSLKFSMAGGAAVYAATRCRSNGVDGGLRSVDAGSIVKPFVALKKQIVTKIFKVEVKGIATPEEVAALFMKYKPDVPVDEFGMSEEEAIADNSGERPTVEATKGILQGVDIFSWKPTESDWAKAGVVIERDELAGALQIPGITLLQGDGTPASETA